MMKVYGFIKMLGFIWVFDKESMLPYDLKARYGRLIYPLSELNNKRSRMIPGWLWNTRCGNHQRLAPMQLKSADGSLPNQ
jgi:hypothetical protein